MTERQHSRFILRSGSGAMFQPPSLKLRQAKSSGGKMKHGFAV